VNRTSASLVDPSIRHGGEEGMGEVDAFTVHAHDVRFDRRLKCQPGLDAECARHSRQLWLRQAGDDEKCPLRLGRKDGDASLEELAERPRNRQSSTERRPRHRELERSRDLECVERVPTGDLVDPLQDGPREDDPEPLAHEAVKLSRAQAAEIEAPHVIEKPRDPVRMHDSPGEEKRHPVVLQSPPGIREDRGRRGVEPLNTVDDDQEWGFRGESAKHGEEGDAERARVSRLSALFEQERHPKRASLRLGNSVEDVVQDGLEEIAQARKREIRLRRDRASDECRETPLPRRLDHERAHRRLPDSCFPLEESDGGERIRAQVRGNVRELALAPDERRRHGGHLSDNATGAALVPARVHRVDSRGSRSQTRGTRPFRPARSLPSLETGGQKGHPRGQGGGTMTPKISFIAVAMVALVFAVPAFGDSWGADQRQATVNAPPDLADCIAAARPHYVSSMLDACERSFAAKRDATTVASPDPVRDDRFHLDPASSETPTAAISSPRDIEWLQIGIGFGLGVLLALGLFLAMRMARVRQPAH
jgi:hypothetical protein